MTELTFALLKYGFLILLWIFIWLAVRSLRKDIAASDTTARSRCTDTSACMPPTARPAASTIRSKTRRPSSRRSAKFVRSLELSNEI